MAENIYDKERAEELVNQIKNGLDQARGYLLQELIKIGSNNNNKTIDVEDEQVKAAMNSLINSEPDENQDPTKPVRGVLSIKAAIIDSEEKIKKWIAGSKGQNPLDPKYFEDIRKEMNNLPEKIKEELSTQEGINKAIKNRIKNNSILQQVAFFKAGKFSFEKLQEDKPNPDMIGLNALEKGDLVRNLGQNIELPSEILPIVLQDNKSLVPLIAQATIRATECFGEKVENPLICVVDQAKLGDEKNIEKFTKLFNQDVKAFALIHKTLKKADVKDINTLTSDLLPALSKFSPEHLKNNGEKTIEKFAPLLESKNESLVQSAKFLLSELDPDYLARNSHFIADGLKEAAELKGWKKVRAIFRPRYREEKLQNIINEKIASSDEYVGKGINDKIAANSMKDSDLAIRLTKFIKENEAEINKNPELQKKLGITNVETLHKINPEKFLHDTTAADTLAALHKINPERFNEVIFSKPSALPQPQALDSQELVRNSSNSLGDLKPPPLPHEVVRSSNRGVGR